MFQKYADKKRVKQAVEFYLKKHKENPDLSEDDICKLLLKNWIYHTSPMKNTDNIDEYIRVIFKSKNEITIFDACYFGITSEFNDKYNFYEQKNRSLDEHIKISDNLKERINEELRRYKLK